MNASNNLTPMMQRYQSIKAGLPKQAILFFRLGDFYEVFFEDAKTVASALKLSLTNRKGVPMCGFPCNGSDFYIQALTKQGFSVALRNEA